MDLFWMNSEHFAHKPNFFPYFPVWQGKCGQLGLRRDQGQRRALRADWITRLEAGTHGGKGHRPSPRDENSGFTARGRSGDIRSATCHGNAAAPSTAPGRPPPSYTRPTV